MARPVVFSFGASDSQAVALVQTVASGGSLAVNGTASYGDPWARATASGGFSRILTYYSAVDLSGVALVVQGTSITGGAISSAQAGPAASFVSGSVYFAEVTSVTVSGGTATSVSIGFGSQAISNWYLPGRGRDNNPFNIDINLSVSGTISTTVQHTFADVQTSGSPMTANHPVIAASTTNQDGTYTSPIAACRFVVNSSAAGATAKYTFIQAGV